MDVPSVLPAGLLHTRQLSSQSVHTELVLQKHVSLCVLVLHIVLQSQTYSCHAEVTENTLSLAASNTSILDLGGAGVAVHLRQLQLSLGARALRQECVADDVAECLSIVTSKSVYCP